MSELMAEIGGEVKKFLNQDRVDIQRTISRTAIFDVHDSDIEIKQSKMLSAEEVGSVQTIGPRAIASKDWFSDVEWLHEFDSKWPHARIPMNRLSLDAMYPMEYFDKDPGAGTYRGGAWLDQYGSVSGFGTKDEIKTWVLRYVDPESCDIATLRYPDDPTAIDQYNARYQQYLDTLNDATPTISYYRAWDRHFAYDYADKPTLVIGSMALSGFGVYEVLERGSATDEDNTNNVGVTLTYQQPNNGYDGRRIDIIDGHKAMTYAFGDVEEETIEEPSEELLVTTLKLIQDFSNN